MAPKNQLSDPALAECAAHPRPAGVRHVIPEAAQEEIEYALAAIDAPFENALSEERDVPSQAVDSLPAAMVFARPQHGWQRRRIFLLCLGLLALVFSFAQAPAYAQELPDMPQSFVESGVAPIHAAVHALIHTPTNAPVKPGFLSRGEVAAVMMDAGARAMDWVSTEECQRRPWSCHESELPVALVRNKAGFAALEASEVATGAFLAHMLHKSHHDRLAMIGESIEIGCVTGTVIHNYSIPAVLPSHAAR